jgi:hypothetical protein
MEGDGFESPRQKMRAYNQEGGQRKTRMNRRKTVGMIDVMEGTDGVYNTLLRYRIMRVSASHFQIP